MLPFARSLPGAGLLTSALQALRTASPQTLPTPSGATSAEAPRPLSGIKSTAEVVGKSELTGKLDILGKIATRYDVKRITPREFSRLLEELRQAGVLADTDRQLLAQILVELHQEGNDLDETVDLVRWYTKKVEKLQESLQTRSIPAQDRIQLEAALADLQKRLDWLRRFTLLHECPDLASLNLLS